MDHKYLRYKQKYVLLQKNYNDIIKIKNGISMTMDNIYYFSNKSEVDKRYLYKFSKKYNHEELEILLRISVN